MLRSFEIVLICTIIICELQQSTSSASSSSVSENEISTRQVVREKQLLALAKKTQRGEGIKATRNDQRTYVRNFSIWKIVEWEGG